MSKLAIEVCFENHFGLIRAIFLSLGSTKFVYFFWGHPVYHRNEDGVRLRKSTLAKAKRLWQHTSYVYSRFLIENFLEK